MVERKPSDFNLDPGTPRACLEIRIANGQSCQEKRSLAVISVLVPPCACDLGVQKKNSLGWAYVIKAL